MATTEIAGLLYKLVGEIQNTSPYAAASWTSFSSPGLRRASLYQGLQHWSPPRAASLCHCWAASREISAQTSLLPCATLSCQGRWSVPWCTAEVPGGMFCPLWFVILPLPGCQASEWRQILACDCGALCRKTAGRTQSQSEWVKQSPSRLVPGSIGDWHKGPPGRLQQCRSIRNIPVVSKYLQLCFPEPKMVSVCLFA